MEGAISSPGRIPPMLLRQTRLQPLSTMMKKMMTMRKKRTMTMRKKTMTKKEMATRSEFVPPWSS